MKAHGPKLYPTSKKARHAGEIVEADFKFVPVDPEPGFDPAHNRRVMEATIKKTNDRERRLKKEYMEKVEERVDAGLSLLKKMADVKFNPATDDASALAMKHFGRKELARLRGEQIRQELMQKMELLSNVKTIN